MAQVDKLECQYSYEDGDDMVFLNMESFEEVCLPFYCGCTYYGCT